MKVSIVKWYYENIKSVVRTQRTFKRVYKCKTAPCGQTIRNLVKKFEEDGSVANKSAPGPVFTARTPHNIAKIQKKIEESPRHSQRMISRKKKISKSTVRRILVDDLSLFPYKIQVLQKQSKNNKKQRRDYAKRISQMIEDGILDIRKIHWSDEANFHLSGHVNRLMVRPNNLVNRIMVKPNNLVNQIIC